MAEGGLACVAYGSVERGREGSNKLLAFYLPPSPSPEFPSIWLVLSVSVWGESRDLRPMGGKRKVGGFAKREIASNNTLRKTVTFISADMTGIIIKQI